MLIGLGGPAGSASAVHAVPPAPIVTTVQADGPGTATATRTAGTTNTPEVPEASAPPAPDGTMAETGAGVLPWIALAGAAALGVGAVAFAMVRRRAD